jgi:hypothetical protein
MKTGFAMLVGASVLSLAVGVGTATAAINHHRHMARSQAAPQAPEAARADFNSFEDAHNPAKKYPTRHMSDGAIKTSTLPANGNNSAKPYAVRHAPENAMREATSPQNGNNPAKHYKSTASTTGAAPR